MQIIIHSSLLFTPRALSRMKKVKEADKARAAMEAAL
jgi:hypothetical protein